jgi:hypothetical protein
MAGGDRDNDTSHPVFFIFFTRFNKAEELFIYIYHEQRIRKLQKGSRGTLPDVVEYANQQTSYRQNHTTTGDEQTLQQTYIVL